MINFTIIRIAVLIFHFSFSYDFEDNFVYYNGNYETNFLNENMKKKNIVDYRGSVQNNNIKLKICLNS